MRASTRARRSVGGFFSTPPKNFSHSIWSCRNCLSRMSRSSLIGEEGGISGPFAHEEPEQGQPELGRVGNALAVDEDFRARPRAHDLEQRAHGGGLARLEGGVMDDAARLRLLALEGRAAREVEGARRLRPLEGLELDGDAE